MKIKKLTLSLLLGGVIMNNAVIASCAQMWSDSRVRKSVDKTIDRYPDLDDDVSFEVEKGRVTLTGDVDSSFEKQQAGQLVSNVANVKSVDNRLTIQDNY